MTPPDPVCGICGRPISYRTAAQVPWPEIDPPRRKPNFKPHDHDPGDLAGGRGSRAVTLVMKGER